MLEWLVPGSVRVTERAWWAGGLGLIAVASAVKDAWDKKMPYCMLLALPNFGLWAYPLCIRLAVYVYASAVGLVGACTERVSGVLAAFKAKFATRNEMNKATD